MREIKGSIWRYHEKGYWIVIPTNGFVRKNGKAVMGRGLAYQAMCRFPVLPKALGDIITKFGNRVCSYHKLKLIFFPVKYKWWERANLDLIEKSCEQLRMYVTTTKPLPVYLPRVGCGNGKLKWEDVKPILEKYLDEDKFVICDWSD